MNNRKEYYSWRVVTLSVLLLVRDSLNFSLARTYKKARWLRQKTIIITKIFSTRVLCESFLDNKNSLGLTQLHVNMVDSSTIL